MKTDDDQAADRDRWATKYVEWLERKRPEGYEQLLFIVHTKDARPDAVEVVYEDDEDRARTGAVEREIRRRERQKAQDRKDAACDAQGRWTRTSYGTVRHEHDRISTASVDPVAKRRSGRAPREASNARRRGSRRTSSPTRAGPDDDPGESDDSDDGGSAPPPRTCQLPGCDLPAKRKYCCPQHGLIHRVRRHRARTGAKPVRFRRDDHLGLVQDGWDRHRPDPYKRFDTELWRFGGVPHVVALEELKRRAREGCRCNGHHIADESGQACTKCGHWRTSSPEEAPFYAFLRKQVAK